MIVEFVGCTGAGKTTLMAAARDQLAQMASVTTSFEEMATPFGMQNISQPTMRNLIQEVIGFPFFIRSLPRYRSFLTFILRMLARHGRITFYTVNYLRCLERTVGVHEKIRRHDERDRIILVDEGTMLSAHNVFVNTSAEYTLEEVARYADLVPLPDLIVYIKAPVDSLVKRACRRADPPREIRAKDQAQVEAYINRTVNMFEQLVMADSIQNRTLTIENFDATDEARDLLANDITAFILNKRPVGQRVLGLTPS